MIFLKQDTIDKISRLNSKTLDQKVLETVRRVKSISVMKTSLDKLVEETEKVPENAGAQKSVPEIKEAPKATAEKTHSNAASSASTTSSSSANKNVAQPGSSPNKYAASAINFLEMMKNNPEKVLKLIFIQTGQRQPH